MSLIRKILTASFIAFAATPAAPAMAAEFETVALADGTELTYALAVPDGFRPDNTYPLLLAFPPGGQTRSMVTAGLESFWEAEGTARGFVVVSPVTPGGLFFRESARHIPGLLDHLLTNFRVRDGRVDVAGVSNGGLSAFRAALDQPDLIRSLTVVPGFPPVPEDWRNLAALDGITVSLFVGSADTGWIDNMRQVDEALRDLGQDPLLHVAEGEGHFVQSLAGPAAGQLFDAMTR